MSLNNIYLLATSTGLPPFQLQPWSLCHPTGKIIKKEKKDKIQEQLDAQKNGGIKREETVRKSCQ